jgi:hypothetical protein
MHLYFPIAQAVEWWLWHYATSRQVAVSTPDEVNAFFSNLTNPSDRIGLGVYAASNRNEYQKGERNNVSGE